MVTDGNPKMAVHAAAFATVVVELDIKD